MGSNGNGRLTAKLFNTQEGQAAANSPSECFPMGDESVGEFTPGGLLLGVWCENGELLAYPREDVIGRHISEFVSSRVSATLGDIFRKVAKRQQEESVCFQVKAKGKLREMYGRVCPIVGKYGKVNRIRLILRDVGAERGLLNRLRSTEKALEQITSFSRRMNERLDVATLFELLVGEVMDSTRAQIGGVAVRRGNMFVSEGYYSDGKYFRDRRVWKPEDPLTQWFLLRRVPCLSNSVKEDARLRAKERGGIRLRTLLSTPIFDRNGEVIGFVGVANEREARGFDDEHVSRTVRLVQMAAGYIQNAITLGRLDHAGAKFRRLSAQVLNVQNEERRRIAKLLHETTVQDLLAVKMNLGKVSRDLGNPKGKQTEEAPFVNECRGLVDESLSLATGAMQGVRTLAYVLHPPLLDESGLACALEWFVKGFAKRSEIALEFQIARDVGRLPREMENAMFRVAQESLGNIHRHSGSTRASVRLWRKDQQVILEIEDYGKGMIFPEAHEPEYEEQLVTDYLRAPGIVVPGVGIAGMRERVEQFGGSLEVRSSPGHGTQIRVTMEAKQEQSKEEGGDPGPRKFAAAGGASRS